MRKRVLKKVGGNSEGVEENERVTKYSKKVVREIKKNKAKKKKNSNYMRRRQERHGDGKLDGIFDINADNLRERLDS